MNCISRLEPGTTEWNYYNDENIEHGYIVFDEYADYSISKGLPFNEYVEIEVKEKVGDLYTFVICAGNISNDLVLTDIEFVIRAKNCYLYDPTNDI